MRHHISIPFSKASGVGLLLALTFIMPAAAQRHTVNLKQWQFSRDSVNYQAVAIPHDWAINGPFDKKWDLQNVAIE